MLSNYEFRRKDPIIAILKLCICTIALFLIGQYVPSLVEQIEQLRPNYDERVIRVVANSNLAEDQQFKEEIVQDIQEINYAEIENDVYIERIDKVLKEKYSQESIAIKTGDNFLPPKRVQSMFYPQMVAQSIVIEIGAGRGDNWFCSVFPKVCGKEDREPIRFNLWEWLKEKWP